MRYHLVSLNARFVHASPPLFSLRNMLKRHLPDCATTLFHFTLNDPYFETLLTLSDGEPDAIFFSVYIWNTDLIQRLVGDLEQINRRSAVILGGPQVTYGHESQWPDWCTLVRGEIEGLPERFFHDLAAGRLAREYKAPAAQSFPSPYQEEDFRGQLKNRYVYYESTRGCPFACTYCLSSAETGIRRKTLELVERELSDILAYKPRSLRFVDRTFNFNSERALAIWKFLASRAKETQCHFEIAPHLFDDEMFAFLSTVPTGLFHFEIGLQTTNPASLEAVHRTTNQEKAEGNIARLAALETVHLHLDLILGLPFETVETFRKGFNTVFSLKPHYIQMGLLKVLPGTEMESRKKELGLLASSQPPYHVMGTRWMRHDELGELFWFGECVESFYNNRFFLSLFQYLRKVESDPASFFDQLLRRCRERGFFNLAPTQKLMVACLWAVVRDRKDGPLMLELMRYDWLRCGHRFLPECLDAGMPIQKAREDLWSRLPLNYPPYFDHRTRKEFFRQAVLVPFSPAALRELGYQAEQESWIAFLPDTTETLFK
ncbi:MAG: DUF4080 domain-containing protein, partial [bacterium]|nr:DUF4080 domain-containing protein [bacterium]